MRKRSYWGVTSLLTGLAGCSAAILGVGPHETSFIHRNSTRASIREALGSPKEAINLSPPVSVSTLEEEDLRTKLLVTPSGATDHPTKDPDIVAVAQERYEFTGRVERMHDVGEAIALAGYTAGLSELVMVPVALEIQRQRGESTHHVTVWYDPSGKALAYLWKETNPEGVPKPNVPEKRYQAPKVPRVYDHPYEVVLDATKAAILATGFEIAGERPGFVIASRPHKPEVSGGESLNVWVRSLAPAQTKVIVRTLLGSVGIENQRHWNTEIHDRIREELLAAGDRR